MRQAPGRRSISSQSTAAGPCRRRRRVAIAIAALGILWACRPLVASSGERGPVSGDSGQVLRLAPASGALDAPTSRFPDAAPRHHVMGELTCAECHLCTADEGEGSDPGDSGGLPPGPTSASNPALLRESDPVRLCLSCHDGHPGIPDVVGADVNGLADRSAGFFQPPDVLSRDGHTLGHGPAGGNRDGSSHADRVICIDCHNPHGDGFARNLRRLGDAGTTPPLGLFVDPAARGLSRYESSRISFGTLDSDSLREVSSLCTRCHEALSDVPRGDGNCLRHPTYDSERGSSNTIAQGEARRTTVPAHWMQGTGSGFAGTTRARVVVRGATDFAEGCLVDPARDGIFCLTCHKAHGSNQPFGLVWPAEAGTTAVGCDQCHGVAAEGSPAAAVDPPEASGR